MSIWIWFSALICVQLLKDEWSFALSLLSFRRIFLFWLRYLSLYYEFMRDDVPLVYRRSFFTLLNITPSFPPSNENSQFVSFLFISTIIIIMVELDYSLFSFSIHSSKNEIWYVMRRKNYLNFKKRHHLYIFHRFVRVLRSEFHVDIPTNVITSVLFLKFFGPTNTTHETRLKMMAKGYEIKFITFLLPFLSSHTNYDGNITLSHISGFPMKKIYNSQLGFKLLCREDTCSQGGKWRKRKWYKKMLISLREQWTLNLLSDEKNILSIRKIHSQIISFGNFFLMAEKNLFI